MTFRYGKLQRWPIFFSP